MTLLDTNYHNANVLHALFAVKERTALGMGCLVAQLPSRNQTCDQLPDPRLGHAINSWGRSGTLVASRLPSSLSFCDSYSHQLPQIFFSKSNLSRTLLEIRSGEGRRIYPKIRPGFGRHYTGSVSLVFFTLSFGKWLGIPS